MSLCYDFHMQILFSSEMQGGNNYINAGREDNKVGSKENLN